MSASSAPHQATSRSARRRRARQAAQAQASSGSASVASSGAHSLLPAAAAHLSGMAKGEASAQAKNVQAIGGLLSGAEGSMSKAFGVGGGDAVTSASVSESGLLGAEAGKFGFEAGTKDGSAKAEAEASSDGSGAASAEVGGVERAKALMKQAGVADTVWKGETGEKVGKRALGGSGADNYLDLGRASAEASAGWSANKDGAKAKVAGKAGAKLVEAQGKLGGKNDFGKLGGEVNASLVGAEAAGSAEAGVDWDKGQVGGQAKGEVGAYLAKASGKAEGGWRIPFTNIMLGGGVEAGGQIGAGLGGEASASMGAEGFSASLKGSAAFGIGGNLGLNFGVSKADAAKGWFG